MATIYTRATKGSALTWTEGDANITNLNDDKIEAVIEDTAPELGGNLDVGDYAITTTSINGEVTIQADGLLVTAEYIGLGLGESTAYITTVDATSDLELNTNGSTANSKIVLTAGANGDITLTPNGTGAVVISGLVYPTADGSADQVLVTDGAGNLSFATASGGGGAVVDDTAPQLGGNLDVNGNSIVSVSNGNINITPNGTGQTVIKNIEYNEFIHSLGTTSGTITPNVTNGNVQTITLNGNLTFSAFTSPVAGQSLTLIITQDGTGGRTLTSTMKFAGGIKTLSGTANSVDIMTVFYDGTNYWTSLAKGFA